jgi:hypothetical protein
MCAPVVLKLSPALFVERKQLLNNTTGAVSTVDLHNPHPLHPFEDSDSSGRYEFWSLSGEIRPSLKLLKSLKHLDLSFNTFNGISILEFFGSLKNLQYLNLLNYYFIFFVQKEKPVECWV